VCTTSVTGAASTTFAVLADATLAAALLPTTASAHASHARGPDITSRNYKLKSRTEQNPKKTKNKKQIDFSEEAFRRTKATSQLRLATSIERIG
jgi:hypothetical protein